MAIKYFCDRCATEVDSKGKLHRLSFNTDSNDALYHREQVKFDKELCISCLRAVYAVANVYETEVELVPKTQEV